MFEFIKKHGKFPVIPDICQCKNHCGTIVYNGSKYAFGHNLIGMDKSWQIGRKLPPEHIENLRISHLGHKDSPETRLKKSIANSGENNGFFGHKHTEENKAKKRGKLNPSYGKSASYGDKRYWYDSPLQGKISFRSPWELKYAKYLDSNNILWLYEIETFELSDEMSYTPDFFLPQLEKFIEIKGWMNEKSKIKISKFKDEYPWELDVLQKKDLRSLGINLYQKE